MKLLRSAICAAMLAGLALGAAAQNYPTKPVRVIVPFPPGGGTDILARVLGEKLTTSWKQQVIVENRPGAAGSIGATTVAKSPADGHTLLMSSTASLTQENVSQFAPISLVSAPPYIVVVHPSLPAKSIKELVAFAKSNKGKVAYGSTGPGAASHLSAELFKSMAGVDMLHVPYKGVGQAVNDLMGGHVQVMFAPSQAVMPHVQSGRLRALAVTSGKRSSAAPDLPTVAEAGIAGYEAVGWFGLLAPAGTPQDIVKKISADVNRVLAMPDVKERLVALGAEPAGNTPEQFAQFIRMDQAKWAKLIKERGIPLERS
jgi:tripartite-type tricarboxylate transporter receptor subunit TctC